MVDFDDVFQCTMRTTKNIGTGRYRAPEVTLGEYVHNTSIPTIDKMT